MSLESDRDAILAKTQQLLVAIAGGDWNTYAELCDPSLTCFEPEALGNLVDVSIFIDTTLTCLIPIRLLCKRP